MVSLVIIKSISLILIWIIAFFFGYLPILVQKLIQKRGNAKHADLTAKVMTSLHFIAGGVFLGTILLHLIPSVEMQFTTANLGVKIDYPVAQLVIATGLIAFLLMEHFLIFWMDRMRKKGYNDMADMLASDVEEVHFMRHYKEANEYGAIDSENPPDPLNGSCHGPPVAVKTSEEDDSSSQPAELPCGEPVSLDDYETQPTSQNADRTTMLLRSYAIVIALSLHSIFEGMVIGFQKTPSGAWGMFGALSFHKALVAFSLGQKLSEVRDKITNRHVIGILIIFSLMPPIGGVIATIMTAYNSNNLGMQVARAILEGIATGSFMYVTFFDMLKFEAGQRLNVWYSLMLVIGFICISLQMIFMPMSAMVIGSGHAVSSVDNSTSQSAM
ncbi:zinc transporter ZIP1-like [Tubulanus polymorphus]|uniref:zinc transporter ZIP1-like n=1 Tax=Tubulanus polymorphus TaxID=672921 RepID=UPI003DA6CA1C